jgi:hypothetical protein
MSLLPLMMIFSLVFSSYKLQLTKSASLIFSLYVLVMAAGTIHYSKGWNEFREKFIQVAENNTGFVPIEKTALANNSFGWQWNNAQLAIVWSSPCVKSIILNEPGLAWQPYNPRKKLILKDYVKYDPYFLSVDKDITVCDRE